MSADIANGVAMKYIKQIALVLLELIVFVGGLTWVSHNYWHFESGLDIIQRMMLFYAVYQVVTYLVLSTINDIKRDEYTALKNMTALALKACEYDDIEKKKEIENMINEQLKENVFNDAQVKRMYENLKIFLRTNNKKEIEYIQIWATHCSEESQLQWKYTFLLRLVK